MRSKSNPLKPTEAGEQEAVFEWAKNMQHIYPELRWLYHCPNGEHRHIAVATRLKAQGVKAGISDIFLPTARGGYHGLYIEMKVGDNGATDEQMEFLAFAAEQDYAAMVCYGADDAISVLKWYLKLSKGNRDER